MHATIVFLSALVAVAAGQYLHGGYIPFNHALGVPLDTPEVYHAKVVHAHAHAAAAARSGVFYRKRREAPAAEASAPEAATANAQPTKRQVAWGWGGYAPSWVYPTAYSSYGYSYPLIYKKKRDTAAVSSKEESNPSVEAAENPRDKKQISYLGYWGGWGPSAYAATWPTYPHYLYRKRRDVSGEDSHEDDRAPTADAAAASDAPTKDKRQIIIGSSWGYPAYTTPYLRTGLYNPWGLGGYLYRKRRDVTAEETNPHAAPEETTSTDSKQKRQLLLGLGYPYTPYVMPYYGARLSHWW